MAIVHTSSEAGPSRMVGSIFTDLTDFSCPFTSSPTVVSPRNTSPGPSSRRMAFPKIPVPPSSCSTDSEILSDGDGRTTSPSLISSLFSRNPSSCSTSSQATPITPTSSHKPILRRPECTSASTSASEDGGRPFGGKNGLGLSSMTIDCGVISRKRSTLTFAVKCAATSDSGHSPTSYVRPCRNLAKSPARLPSWRDNEEDDEEEEEDDEDEDDLELYEDLRSPVWGDDSNSDDEGYEEDEEGGFTDDEDLIGTFTGHSRRLWVPSARWAATQVDVSRRRSTYDISAPTSDDGCPVLKERGRKISIATSKSDRCPRHVSPPPSRASSPPPSTKSACPPAARSPSAIGLCRRREVQQCNEPASSAAECRGWRSDNGAFGHSSTGLQLSTKVSCPPPSSILRTSIPASPKTPQCGPADTKLSRRVSAPACSAISAVRCFNANQSSLRLEARQGLEAYMRRGSAK